MANLMGNIVNAFSGINNSLAYIDRGDLIRSINKFKLLNLLIDNNEYPIDLHMHTNNSDGKLSPQETLENASKSGVKFLTFTEHNFIAKNYFEQVKLAKTLGITIEFPGVEIDAIYNSNRYHLLSYGTGLLDDQFQYMISKPLDIRNEYYGNLVEGLKNKGLQLPCYSDILKGIDNHNQYQTPYKRQITRSQIVNYIEDLTGEDRSFIRSKYLPLIPNDLVYSQCPSVETVIKAVKDLGGIVGLAHPYRKIDINLDKARNLLTHKQQLGVLKDFKKMGLDGVETHHPDQSISTQIIIEKYAKDLSLLILGGSDYHGKIFYDQYGYPIQPGTFGLTMKEYSLVKERLM